MRVLVTGASSPLGEAVCRSLRRRRAHVTGTVRRARAGWSSPDVDHVVVLNLESSCDFNAIRDGFDAVIHVAAASDGTPDELMIAGGLGTERLAACAERVGVKKILHVSSIAVYGDVGTQTICRDTPALPTTPVGIARWAAERYLAACHPAVRSVSVRSPAIAGARTHRHFLARTFRAMQLDEPVIRVANPDFMFNNIVHEDTLADFLVHLAEHTPTPYTAVPVGSTEPMSLQSIVEILASTVGYRGRIEWVSATSQPFAIDSSDAVALGYQPLTTRETVDRWMADVSRTR